MFRNNNNLSQNSQSSLKKPQVQTQMKNQQPQYNVSAIKQRNYANLSVSNQSTQYFCFKLQSLVQPTDPTVAWKYSVPILKPNQKNIYLSTQTFTTTLKGFVGQQYPQTISIGLTGFSGFIDEKGISTNKIIILNIYQTQTYIVNGILYKDIIYKNDNTVMWNLGTLRNLTFSVYIDDVLSPVQFPITNPLSLSFRIVHVSL